VLRSTMLALRDLRELSHGELRRINLPRTRMNKEKKKGRSPVGLTPCRSSRPLPLEYGEIDYDVLALLTGSSVILSTSAEASSCFPKATKQTAAASEALGFR
jgi:hypothetical protein